MKLTTKAVFSSRKAILPWTFLLGIALFFTANSVTVKLQAETPEQGRVEPLETRTLGQMYSDMFGGGEEGKKQLNLRIEEMSKGTQNEAQPNAEKTLGDLKRELAEAKTPAERQKAAEQIKAFAELASEEAKRASEETDSTEKETLSQLHAKVYGDPRKLEEGINHPRVTAVGGFNGGWHAAVSKNSPYGPQSWTFSAQFPTEWIKSNWSNGLRITGVAGDANYWFVVMSYMKDGSLPTQTLIGPRPFDNELQTQFANYTQQGYRITALSGFGQRWLMVMTGNTGWGKQRFSLPSSSNANAKWLNARASEGFCITAGSGDRVVNRDGTVEESYVLVATQGTGYRTSSYYLRSQSADSFLGWFKKENQSGSPLVLLGYTTTMGAILSTGTPHSYIGSQHGRQAQFLQDWLLQSNCNKR